MCVALGLNRSSYYKRKKKKQSKSELLNVQITQYVKEFYEESNGVLGYRQMCININREKTMYYLKRFTSREELVSAIEEFIRFYNTRRYQKRLNCMTPCEYYFATAV